MPARLLTEREARETAELIQRHNGDQTAAARAAGMASGTMSTRIRAIRMRFPKLAKLIEPPPKTITERAVEQREKRAAADLKRELKEAFTKINDLTERLQTAEWARNLDLQPANWTLDTRATKGKSPHIPLLLFSDAQAGEVVRPNETDAPWAYDSKIFRERYRKMIATACDLMTNHRGANWTFPGFIYCRGGDQISGGLHVDLRELGEDCTVIEQCEMVAEEEVAGIRHLADVFGRVEVQTPGAAGNHDRTTFKPPSKLAAARSYDRVILRMIADKFLRDKRVTFHTSQSPDIRFPIFDLKMLLTHGDRIGARGGMGFIGPAATIMRGWQKIIQEQARLGYMVDMILNGHFHFGMDVDGLGIANGSYTGLTEFGKQFRVIPRPPLQYLAVFHPKHGHVDTRKIYLT